MNQVFFSGIITLWSITSGAMDGIYHEPVISRFVFWRTKSLLDFSSTIISPFINCRFLARRSIVRSPLLEQSSSRPILHRSWSCSDCKATWQCWIVLLHGVRSIKPAGSRTHSIKYSNRCLSMTCSIFGNHLDVPNSQVGERMHSLWYFQRPSENMDDTGMFSVHVIETALQPFDLKMINLESQEDSARRAKDSPTLVILYQ